jgi:hypothetical protein
MMPRGGVCKRLQRRSTLGGTDRDTKQGALADGPVPLFPQNATQEIKNHGALRMGQRRYSPRMFTQEIENHGKD